MRRRRLSEPTLEAPAAEGATPRNASSIFLGVAAFWSVWLPARIARLSSHLAAAFADGSWTAAVPAVAALAPLLAFGVGLFARAIFPEIESVYTESLLFLVLVVVVAQLSGAMSAMLLLGYVIGDLAASWPRFAGDWWLHTGVYDFVEGAVGALGGPIVSYLLLAILMIVVPSTARHLAADTLRRYSFSQPAVGVAKLAVYTAIATLLVFAWSHAMILLVGPVFTWYAKQQSPSVAAVENVQFGWPWLVAATTAAIGVRFALTWRIGLKPDIALRTVRLRLAAARSLGSSLPAARPTWPRIAVQTVLVTLILSGAYLGIPEALAIGGVVLVLLAWRGGRLGQLPTGWVQLVSRVPAVVRGVAAVVGGFALSLAAVSVLWEVHQTVRLVLLGMLLALALFHALFPPTRSVAAEAPA